MAMIPPMTDERDLELYRQFRGQFQDGSDLGLKPAPYPKLFLDDETIDGTAMVYCEMASDTLRELANAVNEFRRYITQLDAWRPVYDAASDDEQYSLLLDHIRPIAHHCLNAPYSIRGRIINATCFVSLFAGRFVKWPQKRPDWRGKHADMKTAKRLASAWSSWPTLASALGAMNGEDFCLATGNFRDDHHHGHPRSVGMGHVWGVHRVSGEREGWSFASYPPLAIADLIPLLCTEHHRVRAAFDAYYALLQEQAESVPRRTRAIATE